MKRTLIFCLGLLVPVMCLADVQLNVDAHESNLRPISKRIYGVNIANWAADHYLRMCQPRLVEADVSVVRYGATNIERYNWRNNRMYNVISLENQYVPMSWRTFVDWCINEMDAEPFIQVPAFGHVASDVGDANYNSNQPISEISAWVNTASNVHIWGIGNEPFIAWKLVQYQGEGYSYNDGAHGDQIFLEDLAPEEYYPRWIEIGAAIRGANNEATILGPTPANWYLYWGTDYSEFCPANRARSVEWPSHIEPYGYTNDAGWHTMAAGRNQFDGRVFPGRAGQPDFQGWEKNDQTGAFNDKRNMCFFIKHVADYAATHGGTQVCDYLDFHRYMNTDNEAAAVQEVRDLWDEGFSSSDKETGNAYNPKIARRFQNIIDHYYTNQMGLSLSEYDYFYWQGHPDEPQISALGQIDYLGTFARFGVQLACNWYIGEPDQSGGGYHHAADAAKQAMFNERGEPNPKYWAFKMMSLNFRDQAVKEVEAANKDLFSLYAGVNTSANELTVCAHYKGLYYPWNDPHHPGGIMENQGNTNASMVISNFTITGVKKVQRFGRNDPYIMDMEPNGVMVTPHGGTYEVTAEFEPLSIYLFTFYGDPAPPAEAAPETYLHINPRRYDVGPYETGVEVIEDEDEHTGVTTISTNFKCCIKISNNRNSNTTWSVSESASWLSFISETSGVVEVTDRVFFKVDRTNCAVGVYSTDVTVVTSEGSVVVPVTMEVIPGEEDGEARICDFDTGSLAHTWTVEAPYSIGFYDQHGQPADQEGPYVYNLSMDTEEISQFGGLASMRVDFDRSAGDDSAGRLYLAFGTYGHTSGELDTPPTMWVPYGEDPTNYVLKFDIKTKTEGPGFTKTKFIVIVTDTNSHVGKPDVGLSNFKESMELEDGGWQTIAIPLGSTFYDWRYPQGQNGTTVNMDFTGIEQLEFMPWVGHEDKQGTLWLDNIRIETLNAETNRYPVAVVSQDARLIATNETVQLSGTGSHDPDGSIVTYSWAPPMGLSAVDVAEPVFTPPGPGSYVFELTVTDNDGLKSRNPAQVVINVQPTLYPASIELYRDPEMTDQIVGVASNCIDVYAKLTCSAGGVVDAVDFTMLNLSSDDVFAPDDNNNVDPIHVALIETDVDSRIFTGQFKLAAFSDEVNAEMGVSEGSYLTISNNGYSVGIPVGKQWYGLQTIIDHVEDGVDKFNAFEGVWNTYDDNPNGNSSVVSMAVSADGATTNSTQSVYCQATLDLATDGSSDQLFAGVMTKLTAYTNDILDKAVTDISSTSGYCGVSFWLKGNGTKVSVVVKSLAVTNFDDFVYTIDNTPTNGWRKYTLLFADFNQEGWGNQAIERDVALRQANALQFKFASKQDGQQNELWIDDVAFIGGSVYPMEHAVYNKYNLFSCEGSDGGLLTNSSFTGAGAPGWTREGNATIEDWGNWRLVFENWSNTNHGKAYQYVNVDDTKAYQFGLTTFADVGFAGEIYANVTFYDAATNILRVDSLDLNDGISTSWQTFTTDWLWAPTNATFAKVLIEQIHGVIPPYTANAVHVDDVTFVEYGSLPDDGWVGNWIPGAALSYSDNACEGVGSMELSSTNTDWLAGMFVAPYDAGLTRTNLSPFAGFVLKAIRPDGFASTGDTAGRVRIAVATNEDPVARTRWYRVDASEWEDYITFPKEKFLTAATVDEEDPDNWVIWTNAWTDIKRIIVEYGPARETNKAFNILIDDLRPYAGSEMADIIVDAPITNPSASTNVFELYNDSGVPMGVGYQNWSRPLITYRSTTNSGSTHNAYVFPAFTGTDPHYTAETPPEGTECAYIGPATASSWGLWTTQYVERLVWYIDASLQNMLSIDGDYAFCQEYGAVQVIDISDVDSPTFVSESSNAFYYINDLHAEDGMLYVVDDPSGNEPGPLSILDASDPSNLVLVGECTTVNGLMDIDVEDGYAYVVERQCPRTLHIIDVSDPAHPTVEDSYDTYSDGHLDLVVTNGYAYLTGQQSGLQVFDVSDPSAISVVYSNAAFRGLSMLFDGEYIYQYDYAIGNLLDDIGYLRVLYAPSPASISEVSKIKLSNNGLMYDMTIVSNRLYGSGDCRLRVIDITDPMNPRVEAYSSGAAKRILKVANKDNRIVTVDDLGMGIYSSDQTGTTMDLSDYANGFLSFYVKSGEDLYICIRAGGVESEVLMSDYGWSGTYQWEKITIPMTAFRFSSEDMAHTFQPFATKVYSSPSSGLDAYIDNVYYHIQPE